MEPNSPQDVAMAPAASTPVASRPALPLGWTRVKRKRPDGDEECACDDPSCQRRAPLTSASVPAAESIPTSTVYRGTAIFCLHEMNPDWMQGYFFHQRLPTSPTGADTSFFEDSARKPWGLLCEQQEIDDCLKCAEGGYRVVSLTVYPFQNSQGPAKKVVIPNVEWTGGDMIRFLQAQGRVRFEPDRLWTEEKAVPFVQGVFGSLVRQLVRNQDEGDDTLARSERAGVLKVMPDVAIVYGAMELVLPNDDEQATGGFE